MSGSSATETRDVQAGMRSGELRVGAGLALVGTLIHAVSGAFHGVLTAGTGQASAAIVFEYVNAHPAWAVVNFGILVGTLTWLGAFLVVSRRFHHGGSWRGLLSQLAVAMLAIGIAAATLLFLVDAVVIPNLAAQWSAAAPARQAELVTMGNHVQSLIRIPLFHVMPLFLFGLPFALIGAAHLGRGMVLPAWLGWLGLLVGTASFLTGCLWVLDINFIPETVMWAVYQPLIWVWVIAAGVTLWRQARATAPGDQATTTTS